jgi:hypothetical protein
MKPRLRLRWGWWYCFSTDRVRVGYGRVPFSAYQDWKYGPGTTRCKLVAAS